jgi:hypothetical protein
VGARVFSLHGEAMSPAILEGRRGINNQSTALDCIWMLPLPGLEADAEGQFLLFRAISDHLLTVFCIYIYIFFEFSLPYP